MRCLLIFMIIVVFSDDLCANQIRFAEPGDCWYSGQRINRSLLVDHPIAKFNGAQVQWQLLVAKTVVKKGGVLFKGNKSVLNIDIPASRIRVAADLNVNIIIDKKILAGRTFKIFLYPPKPESELSAIFDGMKVGIFDVHGRLRKIFIKGKVTFESLQTEAAIYAFTGDLLIIGPDSLDTGMPNPIDLLKKNFHGDESFCPEAEETRS